MRVAGQVGEPSDVVAAFARLARQAGGRGGSARPPASRIAVKTPSLFVGLARAVVSVGKLDVAAVVVAARLVVTAPVLVAVNAAAFVCGLVVAVGSRVAEVVARPAGALVTAIPLVPAPVALMVFDAAPVRPLTGACGRLPTSDPSGAFRSV